MVGVVGQGVGVCVRGVWTVSLIEGEGKKGESDLQSLQAGMAGGKQTQVLSLIQDGMQLQMQVWVVWCAKAQAVKR